MTDEERGDMNVLTRQVDRLQTIVRVLGDVLMFTPQVDAEDRDRIRRILSWGLSRTHNDDRGE
jgi:glycosyltransferase A (GT-A) superfamily protein (DUF2064 family)